MTPQTIIEIRIIIEMLILRAQDKETLILLAKLSNLIK